jgi:hypothetical protein
MFITIDQSFVLFTATLDKITRLQDNVVMFDVHYIHIHIYFEVALLKFNFNV